MKKQESCNQDLVRPCDISIRELALAIECHHIRRHYPRYLVLIIEMFRDGIKRRRHDSRFQRGKEKTKRQSVSVSQCHSKTRTATCPRTER